MAEAKKENTGNASKFCNTRLMPEKDTDRNERYHAEKGKDQPPGLRVIDGG